MRTPIRYILPLLTLAFTLDASSVAAQQRGRVKKPTTIKATANKTKKPNRQRAARPTATNAARLRTTKPAVAQQVNKTTRSSFEGLLKKSGSKFFVRTVNGAKRVIANISGPAALAEVSKAMGKQSDVVQILHIGRADIQHTMAIFDGELIHTQHVGGTGNWRLRSWGDTVRDSNTKMFSAFIALTPAEATAMRNQIKTAKSDQGPEHLAGPNWSNGKLGPTSLGGHRGFDCTSTWTDMPIGAKGETLAQIVGFTGQYSRHPKTFQKSLETGGNDRILAVAVYGPKVTDFGKNPDKAIVEF